VSTEARSADLRFGIRLEAFTVAWMVLEAALSIGAGVVAGSFLLVAFGLDSVIELISGSVLLWRLTVEAGGGDRQQVERVEHRAIWVVAITLALLCLYVLASSVYGLVTRSRPESAPLGIGIAAAAVIVMPYLALAKRRVAARINSDALRGDAAESLTCGYMAATVLAGLAFNALFHWWWAEDIAALAFLYWLFGETREAFEEAVEAGHDPSRAPREG
jgi:divalent metal cation (Fe/Co/Zn/Cd) transporter